MRVSATELKAALRRFFEASGYHVGNFEDAANMVLWLEMLGLSGMNELQLSLAYLEQDSDRSLSKVIYEDLICATIESHGRSGLNCLAASIDFAEAKAKNSGTFTLHISNCHNRIFILKALIDSAKRGFNIAAKWKNGTGEVAEYFVTLNAGEAYPCFEKRSIETMTTESDHSLTLMISSEFSFARALSDSLENVRITPDQFLERKQQSIDLGLDIDQDVWNRINEIGARVLVESNDSSRAGAGGR